MSSCCGVCADWPSSGHKLLHLQIFYPPPPHPPLAKELLLLRLIVPGTKDAEGMSVMKSSLCENWRNALRDCSIYWATTPRNVMKRNLKTRPGEREGSARAHTHTLDGTRTLTESHTQTRKWQGRTDDPPQSSRISGGKLQQCPAPELPHPSELSPSRKSPFGDYWTLIAFTLLEQDLAGECRCRSFCTLH